MNNNKKLLLILPIGVITVLISQFVISSQLIMPKVAQFPAAYFGNLTRDGSSAPVGTIIRAFVGGIEHQVNNNHSTSIGEHNVVVYGNTGDNVTFKINNFTANSIILCTTFDCGIQQLDIACTNCNNPSNLSNISLSSSTGNVSSVFNFTVAYSDSDNDAPLWVNVTINGDNGSESHIMNGNYSNASVAGELTNSRFYYYQTNLARGSYNYSFSTYDGFNLTQTTVYSGPTISNIVPKLEEGSVDPTVGTNINTYNFSVTYMDYDNDTPVYINVTIIGTSVASYAMNETDTGDNEFTDGKKYQYITTLQHGNYSYYFTAYDGYNTTQNILSQNPVVGKLNNGTYSFYANVSGLVNLTDEANVSLEIISSDNVTNASVNVTLFQANPTNGNFLLPGLDNFIKVDISTDLNGSLASIMLKRYYTQNELDSLNILENSLAFYWFNESSASWMKLNETWNWVYGTGVDNNNYGAYAGNVWANISHASYFKIGGETSQYQQIINLQYGWNLISIPLEVQI